MEGSTASFTKTITEADVVLFAGLTGDTNPLHIDAEYARQSRFGQRIAHGMLTAGLISTVIGTKLPGPGAIYMRQTLEFMAPVHIGDTVTATGTIASWDGGKGPMTIDTVCSNQRHEEVLRGQACILYRP
ncbi:MAG: MaoC family dehydratase [Chloroflexota bacterium]